MNNRPKLYPSNPLGIIATFVFFIEAIGASTVFIIKDCYFLLNKIISFIIIFPSTIALIFFIILIYKRQILFGPSDFQNEKDFIHLIEIDRRLKDLEIGQEVSHVIADPPIELGSVFNLVNELIERNSFMIIVGIGRGYLRINQFDKSLKYYEYVKTKIPKNNDYYKMIITNIAYSKIGLGNYEHALNDLNEVKEIVGESNLEIWHLAAMSYVLYKLNKNSDKDIYLSMCKAHPNYQNEKYYFRNNYKDMPDLYE